MISRTSATNLLGVLGICAASCCSAGCAAMCNCATGSPEQWKMPIETLLTDEDLGSLHRIQGTYKDGYELHGRITVCLPQDDTCDPRNALNMTDYCVAYDPDNCAEKVEAATRAQGEFARAFPSFGFVDVVVEYVSPKAKDGWCYLGVVKIVKLLQAYPIGQLKDPRKGDNSPQPLGKPPRD
jgi:hypothetical protein